MKTKYYIAAGISVLILLIFLGASSLIRKERKGDNNEQSEKKQYVCSMHPQVLRDEPGDCPICGMFLIEKIDVVKKKQYVCSMHPQVLRDEPGDCPICGMFLIEKIDEMKESIDSSLSGIVLPVNTSVLAQVTTVTPQLTSLPIVVESPGIINYDPRKIHTISARFGGLIEKSYVKFQFQHIKKGQKIFDIYCPDIYVDRWNYVKLVQNYPDRDDITHEALEWLRLLGLSEGQIDSLKRSPKPDYHLAVYSYAEGYAISKDFDPETFFSNAAGNENNTGASLAGTGNIGLNDGIQVSTGDPLFKLIDVTSLRIDLKVKTEESALLREGQKVMVTDAADPDRSYVCHIDQIEPLNGGLFQSVKVFITDKERHLLPGRQIKARIMAGTREGLWVPVSAVVDLGQRKSVFVRADDKFVVTEVKTGLRSDNQVEILSGIGRDSEIAVKALLLTDSDGFIKPD